MLRQMPYRNVDALWCARDVFFGRSRTVHNARQQRLMSEGGGVGEQAKSHKRVRVAEALGERLAYEEARLGFSS